MSIVTEIQRLQLAKDNMKTVIEKKGIACDASKIDNYGEKILEIPGGFNTGDLVFPYVSNITFHSDLSEITEDIIIHLERASSLTSIFFRTGLTCNMSKITLYISDKCKDMFRTFRQNGVNTSISKLKYIKIIGDTHNITSYANAFMAQRSLEEIDVVLDFSSATTTQSMFHNCNALKEVRFAPNTLHVSISFGNSPNLTTKNDTTWGDDGSIMSIINGLADLTGLDSQTLTVHKIVYQKIIDNGWDALITAKNWTLVSAN